MFALDIPKRHVDARQGSQRQAALALVAQRIVEPRPDLFGFKRIRADKPGGIGRDHRGVRPCRAEAFAPAGGAVVADDLHQHMGTPVEAHRRALERHREAVFQQMRVDSRDFHPSVSRAQ
ncbi:hypothetical protein D3C72_1928680 [compost metagenome]